MDVGSWGHFMMVVAVFVASWTATDAVDDIAFEDLGMEAIYEFEVRDFPVVVAIDSAGGYVHKGIVPIARVDAGKVSPG